MMAIQGYLSVVTIICQLHSSLPNKYNLEQLLQQDPTLWPGHMEPFGSKQKTVEVPILDEWPEPVEFFKKYVEKNRPVAFKGLAKRSPAFKLFTDDYLENFPGSDKVFVTAEPNKKEIRNAEPKYMSFKEFVQKYHNESLYMVNSLPKELRKDVLMPASLRCDETRELLQTQVTWFSSGGTKSVLHNDDVDNINCLYRGKKELLFIEYNRNKKFVPIDHPEGGYSSVDVDSVDYTKFPMLRHVDQYHHITMEEGDCLFIPYHWFHQVNSFANEKGQNLAINVWFQHVFNHEPITCPLSAEEATLDRYLFTEDDKENGNNDDENEGEASQPNNFIFQFVEKYLAKKKEKKISYKLFTKIVLQSPQLNPNKMKISGKEIPDDVTSSIKKIFKAFDKNLDEMVTEEDLDIFSDQDLEELDEVCNKETAVIEDYFEDLYEEFNQDQLREKEKKKDEL